LVYVRHCDRMCRDSIRTRGLRSAKPYFTVHRLSFCRSILRLAELCILWNPATGA